MSLFAGGSPGRRVVAVFGQRQGSGVIITPTTILTCAHVVGSGHTAGVAIPSRTGVVYCQVVWSDPKLDAVLLQSPKRLMVSTNWVLKETPVRMGDVSVDSPIPHCEIVGFPRIQRYDGQNLDVDQYTGTVLPLAGIIRKTMVFEFDNPPAAEPTDGTSPLAGLSGGPVYSGGTLLGIVRGVPHGRNHRRVECVPVGLIFSDVQLREWFGRRSETMSPPRLDRLGRANPDDARHEEEYGEALSAEYRKTKIFGLDELSRRDCEWDLDTAYLSLEASPRPRTPRRSATGPRAPRHYWQHPEIAEEHGSGPQRIEELLATRSRVLLRGDAGAGKTTLIWWLAAHAAAGTLDDRLAELNGLVPFVVPLRTLRARGDGFPSPAQLGAVSRLMIDEAPQGWAGRVLEGGRALLLVDGLDEVPQDDREEAHRWLSQLLRRFPRTRCVVTVRPLAVPPDWLNSEGFEELCLLPMQDADIQAFTAAWHTAARLDESTPETLNELERGLAQQFTLNPALRDLARTPLLCAVICALHRLRQGFLPDTRWELYRSALEMLLGHRDKRRKVGTPEGIVLTVEENQQLLQRIAVWLVRGGQTEFTRDQAVHQLERALVGMPQVRRQGTPEQTLTHLLNRSGLLQERSDGMFQFAHRTFQDFLAAKEFIEGDQLNELLRHASEQEWHDVLLLAAGHCSRRDLPVLVKGLLAAGKAARRQSDSERTALYVLAALCAQHAAWLDEVTHRRVREAIKDVLPPSSARTRSHLARLGPYVLSLLPDPQSQDPAAREQLAELISTIGGSAAIPYAHRLALSAEGSQHNQFLLTRDWSQFPPEEYAREVLAHLDLDSMPVYMAHEAQLASLQLLPRARLIAVGGPISPTALADGLGPGNLFSVALDNNPLLTDLRPLLGCAGTLTQLTIARCVRMRDFTALTALESLEELHLIEVPISTADLAVLARVSRLRRLVLRAPIVAREESLDFTALRALPQLKIALSGLEDARILGRAAIDDQLDLFVDPELPATLQQGTGRPASPRRRLIR
ncbi:NACHT domain-containing protein [Streptomyces albipurpureus]|uniref:NACHT domain-containing protein n=1 Tax=Streptomyces albipurpureus TaxID=2897419 RepID=A0ABT0UZS2_9ACTN|nr:serine protease [Streptomyces sp. CWNU-1]MCM2394054.1 NACHT domain-containing protein [Streptomyces sp. CWNU-1]